MSEDEIPLDDVTEPDASDEAASQPSGPPPLLSMNSLLKGVLGDMAANHEKFKKDEWAGGIRCGFKLIDEDLRGLRSGTLNIFNAGPNVGKSSYSNQVAYGAASYPNQRAGVIYVTYENPSADLVRKQLARISLWGASELQFGEVPPTDPKVQQAAQLLSRVALYYVDGNARLTPDVLIEYVQQIKKENDVTDTLLILDYLQAYSRLAKGANDLEKIGTTLSELRRVAGTTGAALLVIGSQNRETNKGGDPTMFGGRGSGDIEYDADTILVLSKKENDGTGEEDLEFRYLHAVKTRFGGAGAKAKLLFTPSRTSFSEFDLYSG